MANQPLPDQALLLQLLRYEPETGKLFWRARAESLFKRPCMAAAWNEKYAGQGALTTPTEKGYLHGTIFGRRYRAHRVIVCMVTGVWPDQVDHENGVRDNNRWANLRPVNSFHQARNKKRRTDNTSGIVGVTWHKAAGKWMVTASSRYIGLFDNLADAAVARSAATAGEYHPNHGRQ